jgi:4-amino-4-deoxy-L-arabinose transferase-like glycosyltransferase
MPPLYPLLLAIPIYLGIDPELGAVCISMVGSLVLLFCIYSIANKIFKSRHLAELCLLLAAVNRLMVETSYAISRESLYIPLLAVAISFIVTALSSEPKQTKATRRQSLVYLGALFAGLAYATRQEGAEVLICFFLLIAICNSRHRKLFRQLLKKSVLFLLIFWAPSIVLHQFYNSDIGSKWDPLNKERSQLFIKHVLRN